jgi:hypothetical protein
MLGGVSRAHERRGPRIRSTWWARRDTWDCRRVVARGSLREHLVTSRGRSDTSARSDQARTTEMMETTK